MPRLSMPDIGEIARVVPEDPDDRVREVTAKKLYVSRREFSAEPPRRR
jgi:hypothetical protein